MCAGTLAKIVLFLISLIILVLGLAFIVIGSLLLGYPNYLGSLLENLINQGSANNVYPLNANELLDVWKINDLAAGIFLGVGCALLILGILGFLSSCGRNCFIFLYMSILTLLTLAELAFLIYFSTPYAIDLMNDKFGSLMYSSLSKNFTAENYTNGIIAISNKTTTSWMSLQNIYQCCGSYGPDDYKHLEWNNNIDTSVSVVNPAAVPPSCCQMVYPNGTVALLATDYSNLDQCVRTSTMYTNQKGCATEILISINQHIRIPILVLSAASAIQLFCLMVSMIVFACGNNSGRKTSVVI